MNERIFVGVDEVGRGAWAGPLVVAVVALRSDAIIEGLRDSKQLTPLARERLMPVIQSRAVSWAIGAVSVPEVDEIGLGLALGLAAQRAVEGLSIAPTQVLVDGKYPYKNFEVEQQPIVDGDQAIPCIAAASVIAKVLRDEMMRGIHSSDASVRPFRFDLNKGYPSPLHRSALIEHGPSRHHRTSFAPIRALLTHT